VTGRAAFLLAEFGADPVLERAAVNWLIDVKRGLSWGSTSSTAAALRAIAAHQRGVSAEPPRPVRLALNGHTEEVELGKGETAGMRQVTLTGRVGNGNNTIRLSTEAKYGLAYQVVTRYAVRWSSVPKVEDGLSLSVGYTVARPRVGTKIPCRVRLKNTRKTAASNPLIELGLPPGCVPDRETLDAMVEKGEISRYELPPGRAVFYLSDLAAGKSVGLAFPVVPRFAGTLRSVPSTACLYYNPEVRAVARPATIVVR
jgi:hypothetical protein